MPGALAVLAAAFAGFAIGGLAERASHRRRERTANHEMHTYLHRLKNPLQSIILQAELLPTDETRAADARAAIISEAERAASILAEQTLSVSGDEIVGRPGALPLLTRPDGR